MAAILNLKPLMGSASWGLYKKSKPLYSPFIIPSSMLLSQSAQNLKFPSPLFHAGALCNSQIHDGGRGNKIGHNSTNIKHSWINKLSFCYWVIQLSYSFQFNTSLVHLSLVQKRFYKFFDVLKIWIDWLRVKSVPNHQ